MIEYTVDEPQGMVRITASEKVSLRDIYGVLLEIGRCFPPWHTHVSFLTDFSSATMDISPKEIGKIWRIVGRREGERHIRHAHVAHPDEELAASVLCTIMGQHRSDFHACVFPSVSAAECWLGVWNGENQQDLSKLLW
ncbi:hypothetical protein [Chitinivibrio alkaliphilus]|uniref:Uncharacterized protein n=1 Tax=Chitinivibrio alkaliphilus ACht1 TaxID=1313304 RepID=U7D9W0_9BACT|nr:hypothetical protein [Chitinivibrio alkaliphilus]ERP31877.1 hypothetical protein CALK_1092 [Chitinivibrio alkaliphilus ACht1]